MQWLAQIISVKSFKSILLVFTYKMLVILKLLKPSILLKSNLLVFLCLNLLLIPQQLHLRKNQGAVKTSRAHPHKVYISVQRFKLVLRNQLWSKQFPHIHQQCCK